MPERARLYVQNPETSREVAAMDDLLRYCSQPNTAYVQAGDVEQVLRVSTEHGIPMGIAVGYFRRAQAIIHAEGE